MRMYVVRFSVKGRECMKYSRKLLFQVGFGVAVGFEFYLCENTYCLLKDHHLSLSYHPVLVVCRISDLFTTNDYNFYGFLRQYVIGLDFALNGFHIQHRIVDRRCRVLGF